MLVLTRSSKPWGVGGDGVHHLLKVTVPEIGPSKVRLVSIRSMQGRRK